MKLIWAKVGMDVIVGERTQPLSVTKSGATLYNPMLLQHINVMQEKQVQMPGRQGPSSVTGFKFLPIPCSEIFLDRVDYAGEIKERDPVYVTYYMVKKQVDEQDEALRVNQ